MINNVVMMGRLTADPHVQELSDGQKVIRFRIAVPRDMSKNKAVDYFTVVAWRTTGEFVARNFFKGMPILVNGSIQNREFTTTAGETRQVTEVVADKVWFCGGDPKLRRTVNSAEKELEELGDNVAVPWEEDGDSLPL